MTGRAIVLVRRTGHRVHGRGGADVLLPATVVCGAELLRLSGEEAGAGGRAGHCRCKGGHREEQEEEDPTGYGQDYAVVHRACHWDCIILNDGTGEI